MDYLKLIISLILLGFIIQLIGIVRIYKDEGRAILTGFLVQAIAILLMIPLS